MNRKTKLALVAWILIFLAFNLYFVFPLREAFMALSDYYRFQYSDISAIQMILTIMAFILGEIGFIIALLTVRIKSQEST